MQLARQVTRLLADARQQIYAAAREAAAQAVSAEHRVTAEHWEQKIRPTATSFREKWPRRWRKSAKNPPASIARRRPPRRKRCSGTCLDGWRPDSKSSRGT